MLFVVCCLAIAVCCSLISCCLRFVACVLVFCLCLVRVANWSRFVFWCSLFVVRGWLMRAACRALCVLVACCLLFVVCGSLLVVCCLLCVG